MVLPEELDHQVLGTPEPPLEAADRAQFREERSLKQSFETFEQSDFCRLQLTCCAGELAHCYYLGGSEAPAAQRQKAGTHHLFCAPFVRRDFVKNAMALWRQRLWVLVLRLLPDANR